MKNTQLITVLALFAVCTVQAQKKKPMDNKQDTEQKITALMAKMTLEEKWAR